MRVLVTGVTRTGNLGGIAMLCALEDVVRPLVHDFALASILPKRDSAQRGPDGARIVWADYRLWLLAIAPISIVFWPLRRWPPIRQLLSKLPILRDFASADVVADLSGIAFVDGRGLALLYYNIAVVLPALCLDVPVCKLSQALGPFQRPLNRRLAAWTLRRCRAVVARGQVSLQNVHELGVTNAVHRPDTSFALLIPNELRNIARGQLAAEGLLDKSGPLVLMSPSAVVEAYCDRLGMDMIQILAGSIASLRRRGIRVALLPHSSNTGIAKNDDYSVVRRLCWQLAQMGDDAVRILDPKGDPRLARALIGHATVFVASRFHSLIAALSETVPVATIGWSHKYVEAALPFGMAEYTMDYADLSADRLTEMVQEIVDRQVELRGHMVAAATSARKEARDGILLLFEHHHDE